MAKHIFLALTNPVEGKEPEFNEWYNTHHVPDVINVPGFVSGQRFKLSDSQFGGEASKAYKYLAVYEIETDDIAATIKELRALAAVPRTSLPPTRSTASASRPTCSPRSGKR